MTYNTIIFDLDGTLVDSSEGIFNSVKLAASELGLREPNAAELRSFIGPPVPDSFERIYGLDADEAQAATLVFRRYYLSRGIFEARVFDGIGAVLRELVAAGARLGVATYKRETAAARVLAHFGLAEFFGAVRGVDAAGGGTKAAMIESALAALGGEKCAAVLVGDTLYDWRGAAEAGVAFVPVLWGFGFDGAGGVGANSGDLAASLVGGAAGALAQGAAGDLAGVECAFVAHKPADLLRLLD